MANWMYCYIFSSLNNTENTQSWIFLFASMAHSAICTILLIFNIKKDDTADICLICSILTILHNRNDDKTVWISFPFNASLYKFFLQYFTCKWDLFYWYANKKRKKWNCFNYCIARYLFSNILFISIQINHKMSIKPYLTWSIFRN